MSLVEAGYSLILVGFLLCFIGAMLAAIVPPRRKPGERRVKAGGVIFIGPIPIIFGSPGRWMVVALILAFVLAILLLVLGGVAR